jgi:hypothetical protein
VFLPRSIRKVGAAFTALAVLAPLGLIAPGLAFAEGSAGDVKASFGYVPAGMSGMAGLFSAPLAGYNLPLPFFSRADPLWHAALGYQLTATIGMLLAGGLTLLLARLLRGRAASAEPQEGPA